MQGTEKQGQHVEEPWSRWAGISQADRMSHRRQLILDAAFGLVAEAGVSGVTIRAVSRESGIHRRYFHESFESREDLLRAMFDRVVQDVTNSVLESLKNNSDSSSEPRIYGVMRVLLTFARENPVQAEVLFAGTDDPGLSDSWTEFTASFRMLISQPTPAGPASPVRDSILASFLEGAAVEFGRRWLAGEFGDDVQVVAEITSNAILELAKVNQAAVGFDARATDLWQSIGETRG